MTDKSIDDKIPRILYHGTTDRYLYIYSNVLNRKEYGDNVYLDKEYLSPSGYALQRAEQYKARPILLIVDSNKLSYPLPSNPFASMKVKFVNLDSFFVYEMPFLYDYKALKNNKSNPHYYDKDIVSIAKELLALDKNKIAAHLLSTESFMKRNSKFINF